MQLRIGQFIRAVEVGVGLGVAEMVKEGETEKVAVRVGLTVKVGLWVRTFTTYQGLFPSKTYSGVHVGVIDGVGLVVEVMLGVGDIE